MQLALDTQKIQQLCQNQGISYLGLFGSYARDEHTPSSDVDLLVKFDKRVTLLDIAHAQNNFSDLFNKPVDLVVEKTLNPLIRPYVEKDLVTIYEKR